MMSLVLQFPVDRLSPRGLSKKPVTADIIIFPGIRVERKNFDLLEPQSPRRKRGAAQAAIKENLE
jgi:hypothetical protein